MSKDEIIKTTISDFTTKTHKGQEEYFLNKDGHKILAVYVDNKKVDFEVILRLKNVPTHYGILKIRTIERIRK